MLALSSTLLALEFSKFKRVQQIESAAKRLGFCSQDQWRTVGSYLVWSDPRRSRGQRPSRFTANPNLLNSLNWLNSSAKRVVIVIDEARQGLLRVGFSDRLVIAASAAMLL